MSASPISVPNHDGVDSDSIEARVLRVIATSRRLPPESISMDSTFEELGIDSLDRINILFDLENEFDIAIDDGDARQITDLRQMVAGIQQLLAKKQKSGA